MVHKTGEIFELINLFFLGRGGGGGLICLSRITERVTGNKSARLRGADTDVMERGGDA